MSLLDDLDRQSRRIEMQHAHGVTIARQWGPEDAPALVLTHGSFGAWSHWVRNIPALAQSRKVIAFDMPGFGDSDTPPLPISAESMGALVAEGVLQALKPGERFQIAGFSFGGIVGGQAVLLLEDRVDRFFVLGSNALGLEIDSARPPLRSPSRDMSEADFRELHRHNLGVFMFGDPSKIDDVALDLQHSNTRRARVRSGVIPRGDSLAKALKRMNVPVRAIWGEKDCTSGRYLEDRRRLFESLPHCEGFTVIPGAGHWVAYEAPDAVNRILLE